MEWFDRGTPSRELLDQVTGGRPAYLTNRDGHGAWASTRALGAGGHRRAHAGPAGRPDRARRRRLRPGHPARGRRQPGGAPRARGRRSTTGSAGCCSPRSTCTPAASPPGRTRSSATTSARATRCRCTWPRPGREADRPGPGRPVVGPRPGSGAAARHPGPARAGPGGPVPRQHRQDHAGRGRGELHRRDDRALPGLLRLPDRQPGPVPRGRGGAARVRDAAWTRRASRSTCTPSATARSGSRSTRSRPPGPPTAPATTGTTSLICR